MLCLGQDQAEWDRVREWWNFRRRPKADQRAQWNQERDEQTYYPSVTANNENSALNQFNWQGKNNYSVQLFNYSILSRRLSFSRRIVQFWTTTQEQSKSTFAQSNREIERFQRQLMTNRRISTRTWQFTTRDQHFVPPHQFLSSGSFFCVSNSCSTEISERFSSHPDRKFRLSWDCFDLGKRLSFLFNTHQCMPIVAHVTGHSSRGTRILPCAPVGCGTGHAFPGTSIKRENATRCCVLDRIRQSETEWENDGIFEGGRRPTKGRSGTKREMNRHIIQVSQQIMRTQHSISSIDKERIIILFNCSTIQFLAGDCHFREELFNFERRRKNNQSQPSHSRIEK